MKGTIHNRESFLDHLASRLGRSRNTEGVELPKYQFTPQYEVLKGATQDELVEVLKKQCENIHTNFIQTTTENLQATLKELVASYGNESVVTWKDDRFEEYGLTSLLEEQWPSENVDVHVWDYTKGRENIAIAEKANVGITFSDTTLAESGTVVLYSSKDKGRTVSFLPVNYIAIVPKSTIVPRMTQSAQKLRELVKNGEQVASCINYITGPSNSADIEMNLVVGVHGPVRATYIVVDDK